MNMNTNTITVKFYVAGLGSTITLTGDRKGVLETVAIASGADAVEIRHSTNDDGTMVVVDASQAEEYPQFLAEIVADVDDDDSPAPIPVDHPNALSGDHQIWKSAGELMHEEGVTYGTMQQASDAIDVIRSAYATGHVPEMAPGAEDRAVARAKREGVLR